MTSQVEPAEDGSLHDAVRSPADGGFPPFRAYASGKIERDARLVPIVAEGDVRGARSRYGGAGCDRANVWSCLVGMENAEASATRRLTTSSFAAQPLIGNAW
jgi:hypothetical protein